MAENSKIPWTDHTFNPWIGCTKVGPGCDNCYAERLTNRFDPGHWGASKPRRTSVDNWQKPRAWNRRAEKAAKRERVFCASLADVFDNEVDPEWRDDLFDLIRETPWLDWILLTKRIGNVAAMLPADWGDGYPNVWLMITVVNQKEADRDIPKLLDVPATIRGLSIEPQLGPILFLLDYLWNADFQWRHNQEIDWVICGAESGPKARPFNEDWARSLRNQCQAAGTAFFYKQNMVAGKKIETPELDGRRWVEFPRPENTKCPR